MFGNVNILESMGHLNVSGRRVGGDYISVLDIDSPGQDGLFGLRQMRITGYQGATGDEALAFVGIDIERSSSQKLRLWAVNHRPSVDSDKKLLDQTKIGANSTIELFEIDPPNEMLHVQTIASDAIYSPNGIAATGDGGFYVTNDRSCKGNITNIYPPNLLHLQLTNNCLMFSLPCKFPLHLYTRNLANTL